MVQKNIMQKCKHASDIHAYGVAPSHVKIALISDSVLCACAHAENAATPGAPGTATPGTATQGRPGEHNGGTAHAVSYAPVACGD